jgi:hypothetical protein
MNMSKKLLGLQNGSKKRPNNNNSMERDQADRNQFESFNSSNNENSMFDSMLEKRDTVANLNDTLAIQASYYRGGAVYNSKNIGRQTERETKSQRYEDTSSAGGNENNSLTRGDKSVQSLGSK